jgi:hypothetical protein
MNSTIMHCKCAHDGQDALHGPGRRVFNKTSKDVVGKPVWRCTVCATEKTSNVEVKTNG